MKELSRKNRILFIIVIVLIVGGLFGYLVSKNLKEGKEEERLKSAVQSPKGEYSIRKSANYGVG